MTSHSCPTCDTPLCSIAPFYCNYCGRRHEEQWVCPWCGYRPLPTRGVPSECVPLEWETVVEEVKVKQTTGKWKVK